MRKKVESACLRSSDDAKDEEDGKYEEGDFYPAKRIVAGNAPGVAIDNDNEIFRAVGVSEEPDGDENMFKSLLVEGGTDIEVALGIAGNFARAKLAKFLFHDGSGAGGGGDEIDLILFDNPAGEEGGIVGNEILGGKGLDFGKQIVGNAAGTGYKFVVEKVGELAGCVHPADLADLARLRAPVGVAVGFALVIVVAGVGGPVGMGLGIEGPIGKIGTVEGVGQCAAF